MMTKEKLPSYNGVKFQYAIKHDLIDYAIGDCFCKYDMELAKRIGIAMDKYAKNALKLSAAVRKSRKKNADRT